MKKVYLTVAIVAAAVLGMTSCSNKERCWKITGTITCDGESESVTVYDWGTKDDINKDIDEYKKELEAEGCSVSVDKKKHVKASGEDDCLAKNFDF